MPQAHQALDLDALRALIHGRLAQLVPDQATKTPAAAARHSLLAPGKRLRAIITLVAARSYGGAMDDALDAACAVEMIHSSSLVFDDLPSMDDADLRRGLPTAHQAYGEDLAILGGIGLINGAYEAVAQCSLIGAEKKVAIIRVLTKAVGWQGLVHGQALDLSSQDGGEIAAIHEGKTGVLFIAAAEAGGICAPSCSEEDRRRLRAYGRALGFAYQAYDDVIDQVADDDSAGKTTGKDKGKATAVLGGGADLASGVALANQHFDRAREAVGEGAPLAELSEYIRRYFANTVAR